MFCLEVSRCPVPTSEFHRINSKWPLCGQMHQPTKSSKMGSIEKAGLIGSAEKAGPKRLSQKDWAEKTGPKGLLERLG